MIIIPRWQRLVCILMALGALAGIFTQIQNGAPLELENGYLVFKLVAGMGGIFLFSYVAVRGTVPFREKRIGDDV
ncbi:MAG: hypothetical protein COA96_15405 [SAR86 cluster bacterium]|uniref:Uncharacterized protein n=1 Tax=SAR86 cluster bacterium TaxID=2030880 RepID=A0A2A5AP17_9GAMM|nr:MAG: hypothetical protein COA96_15405 [SAR86 cluster bacterium]